MTATCQITYDDQKRRTYSRERAERLMRLAEHLPQRDQALLGQVLEHGYSAIQVAQLTGSKPETVRRRIRQLLTRLDSPLYRFVAGRFDLLPRDLQATAKRHVLEGYSLRETAASLGMSLHRIRQHRKSIETLSRFL